MFVIPKKEDAKVIDPQRMDALPPEGRDVGNDHPEYWERRRQDGAVDFVPADKLDAARERAAAAEAKRNAAAAQAQEEARKAAETPTPTQPAATSAKK